MTQPLSKDQLHEHWRRSLGTLFPELFKKERIRDLEKIGVKAEKPKPQISPKVQEKLNSELLKATREGKLPLVKLLLEKGADVNTKNKVNWTPLHEAAQTKVEKVLGGRTEIVKLLLENGADVNAKDKWGATPLHAAALEDHAEIAKLLIDSGTDLNAQDKDGETPLYKAAIVGNTETVKILLEKGADINAKDVRGKKPIDAIIVNSEAKEMLRKAMEKK